MENRPRPPRPAPRPAPKEPAGPKGGSALETVKLSPEQTALMAKQAAAIPGAAAAPDLAPVTQFAPDPAPARAPLPPPPPPPVFAPELMSASAPAMAPIPGDRSALETVRLSPDEAGQMSRPPLVTVPMDLEEAASLIEQTRTGVPGENESARRRPERPPGDIRASIGAKETTLTKTLVSAQDDVRAALAAGREVHVDLAQASHVSPPVESAAPGADVHVKPFPDVAPGGFRAHAFVGDQTFASSDGRDVPRGAMLSAPAGHAPRSSRWLLPLVAAVSFCVVFGIAVLVLAFRGTLFSSPRPEASASTDVPPSPTVRSTAGPAAMVTAAPTSPASRTLTPAPTSTPGEPSAAPSVAPSLPSEPSSGSSRTEAEARAALKRLGEGIATCARDTIGVLPGTSPAVPFALALIQKGPYASIPRDWSTPVWSCAKFRLESAQPFQIQWQMVKPSVEGMGIAWLDDNADGKPDRAFGFRAALKQRGEPEIGPIEQISPVPPVAPPPR